MKTLFYGVTAGLAIHNLIGSLESGSTTWAIVNFICFVILTLSGILSIPKEQR